MTNTEIKILIILVLVLPFIFALSYINYALTFINLIQLLLIWLSVEIVYDTMRTIIKYIIKGITDNN